MDCNWIGWCALGVNAQAAWVQAVGSLVAIVVAIGVPARQHGLAVRREKRAADLRARALGHAFLADLEIIGERLTGVWDTEPQHEMPDLNASRNTKERGKGTLDALEITENLQ